MANGGKNSMTTEKAKAALEAGGIGVSRVERLSNDMGWVLMLENGDKVSVYDSGKFLTLGADSAHTRRVLEKADGGGAPPPVVTPPVVTPPVAAPPPVAPPPSVPRASKVFLSCGREHSSRYLIETILKEWNIDWLEMSETLPFREIEHELPEMEASFGIVLALPEDIGFAKGMIHERRFRARQNVVFELGFLLAKLGPERVVVLYSAAEKDFEKPADMPGLLYIPFKDTVDEAKGALAMLLTRNGFNIPINAFI